jgi:hypothetical protein
MQNVRLLTTVTCLIILLLGASSSLFAQTPEPAVRPGLVWVFDLGVGQGYDDSPLGTGKGGYFTEFDPALEFQQGGEHGSWLLDFHPMVRHFYGFSVADQVNEMASTKDTWEMSHRWTLELDGSYAHTSDPFFTGEGFSGPQSVTTAVVVSPNNAFIGPEASFTSYTGSATIGVQAGRYTELTFGGDYSSNREDAQGLSNSTSYAFQAGYTKMVQRGQSIGLRYSSQSFTVNDPGEELTTNSLLLSYDFEWKAGRQFELFAGPQYSQVSASLAGAAGHTPTLASINQNVLAYAAGATFSIVLSKRNYFQLAASRRVTNGAAVSGVVIQDEAQLGLSRQFNKRFSASIGGFYSEYQQIGNLPVGLPNGWGVFNSVQFMLSPRSNISITYDYFHQSQLSPALATLFSDNRALIEYHYSFGSLGGHR